MIKEIPLRKEFVTIGFSIVDEIPGEYKEPFRSLLVAVDDDDYPSVLKLYDAIATKIISKEQNDSVAVLNAFLLLLLRSIFPKEKPMSIKERTDGDESAGKKPGKTEEQCFAEIDKAFNEAGISPSRLRLDGDDILLDEKDDEGDVITIDPKAIGKTKKPGEGEKTRDGWTAW